MEQAIKVMRNLINEPRIDGKESPFASYFLIESEMYIYYPRKIRPNAFEPK